MSAESCPHFQVCSAPVCPLDPASLANCAWFTDEDVCRRGDYASTPMVRAQKRIARATCKDSERGCFTPAMLEGITSIGKGTRGLDPEDPVTAERVKKWLSGFKGKRPLTDEQKAVLRVRACEMRASQATKRGQVSQGSKAPGAPGTEPVSEAVPALGGPK